MKTIIFYILVAMALISCTENQRARNFGGTVTIKLEAGQKLVSASWKQDNLWFLLEPMDSTDVPKTKTFYEDSSFGMMNGKVVFVETK